MCHNCDLVTALVTVCVKVCVSKATTVVQHRQGRNLPCLLLTSESPIQLKCPNDWLPHREKCLQFSRENGVWKEGLSNCTRKGATLLLIQDQEELVSCSIK